MSSSNDLKKQAPQNIIPQTKSTAILNNFIINTTNHLNKLSTNVDEQLSEFDKKMHDLEIMTTLFEAKLESLPDEIKSTFPPLQPCNLDDVNPTFSATEINNNLNQQQNEGENQGQNGENQENQEQEKIGENGEEKKEEENQELSPEEDLNKFLEEHSELQSLYKMLKFGVPIIGVTQKANSLGCDMDLVNELFEKAKKVNSSIQ